MKNELKKFESQITKMLIYLGCIGLVLIILITIIIVIIYYKQNTQYNSANLQEPSSNLNHFNISKRNKQKENYEFRTLQNTTVPVVKENSLSDCRSGSLNVDINSISQRQNQKNTDTLHKKASQIIEEASSKKKRPISFRSNYSDDQEENKDLEKEINREINKYLPFNEKS